MINIIKILDKYIVLLILNNLVKESFVFGTVNLKEYQQLHHVSVYTEDSYMQDYIKEHINGI